MSLQDARDDVANARKYAETDFDNAVVSALETLGTEVAELWEDLTTFSSSHPGDSLDRFDY